jgi:uncharacterized protein YceK
MDAAQWVYVKQNQDISKIGCSAHVPQIQTQQGAQTISASITYEDAKEKNVWCCVVSTRGF